MYKHKKQKGTFPSVIKNQHLFHKAFTGVDFIAVKHNEQLQAGHFILTTGHHSERLGTCGTASAFPNSRPVPLCVQRGAKRDDESLQKSVPLRNTGAECGPLWGCWARPLAGC